MTIVLVKSDGKNNVKVRCGMLFDVGKYSEDLPATIWQ
jgi:hypothetical protein